MRASRHSVTGIAPMGWVHSSLVKKGQIVGYYTVTDSLHVLKLIGLGSTAVFQLAPRCFLHTGAIQANNSDIHREQNTHQGKHSGIIIQKYRADSRSRSPSEA